MVNEEQRAFCRFNEIAEVIAALTPEDYGTAKAGAVIICALSQEQPALREELTNQLRAAGMIPEPCFCNERGEEAYSLGQVAEMLDVPMEAMRGDMLTLAEKFQVRLKADFQLYRLQ